MKLHRNAALSWSGRRRLVMHVAVEGVDSGECHPERGREVSAMRENGSASIALRARARSVLPLLGDPPGGQSHGAQRASTRSPP